jgi:ubiquitin-conjugating enzyme E2 Z
LIVGPPDTPYEFGFFEFFLKFGKEYPTKAPTVTSITTNGGRTRFNPNIYAGGKVCLSILGTWRGERGEEWSSAQGLESILISIQSLMSSNPYENEPGFEQVKSDDDKKNARLYVDKIRHESLRISVIDRMEEYLDMNKGVTKLVSSPHSDPSPPEDLSYDLNGETFEPFKDKCKLRFLWYYDSYHQSVDREAEKYKEGAKFERMPFEGHGNQMDGTFQYLELKRRLTAIKKMMDEEIEGWAAEGLLAVEREAGIASKVKRQYEQAVHSFGKQDDLPLDLELVDNNPFVWRLTLVGRHLTNLDGGIINIKMCISPRFPLEQPRVRVETPLFHHRISSTRQLCYLHDGSEDLAAHVQAIINAIEDDNPGYDPRTTVSPDASRLLWGSATDKKEYSRRLRRSVQDSLELDSLPKIYEGAWLTKSQILLILLLSACLFFALCLR